MSSKYVMVRGLAFSEESDMKRLRAYAKQGWLLEGIVWGFFYKLKKSEPQNIVYSVDYQSKADEEYFNMFKAAGWTSAVSLNNEIHIFYAPKGTKPIYTDRNSVIDKYTRIRNQMARGASYSLLVLIALLYITVTSANIAKPIFLIFSGMTILSMLAFVFTFMPYLAFSVRLKMLRNFNKSSNY